jgi:hypothetical protein
MHLICSNRRSYWRCQLMVISRQAPWSLWRVALCVTHFKPSIPNQPKHPVLDSSITVKQAPIPVFSPMEWTFSRPISTGRLKICIILWETLPSYYRRRPAGWAPVLWGARQIGPIFWPCSRTLPLRLFSTWDWRRWTNWDTIVSKPICTPRGSKRKGVGWGRRAIRTDNAKFDMIDYITLIVPSCVKIKWILWLMWIDSDLSLAWAECWRHYYNSIILQGTFSRWTSSYTRKNSPPHLSPYQMTSANSWKRVTLPSSCTRPSKCSHMQWSRSRVFVIHQGQVHSRVVPSCRFRDEQSEPPLRASCQCTPCPTQCGTTHHRPKEQQFLSELKHWTWRWW